jgi:hypothetical protein
MNRFTLLDFPMPNLGSPLFSPSNKTHALHTSCDDTYPHRVHLLRVGIFAVALIVRDSPDWMMFIMTAGSTFSKSFNNIRACPL